MPATTTQWKRWGAVVAVVVLLGACNGRESVTGGYGSGVVTGKVTMAAGVSNSSPAGVRLSVAGTGISVVLAEDGTFALSGVPDRAELRFTRETDGLSASFTVNANGAPLAIELAPNNAHSSGRVRAVNPIQPPYSEFEGLIKTPGATSLVVTDSHGKDVTIQLSDSTVIRHGDTTIAAADLKAGDRVHVKATLKDSVYTATLVLVQNSGDDSSGDDGGEHGGTTMTANGTVKAVGAGQLTVTTAPNGDVTVKVDGSTIIRKQGDIITLADIKVGDGVNTMGTRVDDHTELARQIEVRGSSGHH